MSVRSGTVYLLGIEQGGVCRFEAVHAAEQPGAGLIGDRDFDGVSVQVWPRLILVGSGYTGRRRPAEFRRSGSASDRPLSPEPTGVVSEGLGRLPLLTVLMEARKGDVVPGDPANLVFPNRRLDGSDPEFSLRVLSCW